MERGADFNFMITDEPLGLGLSLANDDEATALLEKTFYDIVIDNKSQEKELIKYCHQFPHIPHFKNRLSSFYAHKGKTQKVKEINLLMLQEHPEYLFGRISVALDYYYDGAYLKMPELLGEHLELDGLYPERKVFHISEVVSYYKVVALYLNAIGKNQKAWKIIDKLESCVPNNSEITSAVTEMMAFNLKNAPLRIAEEEKTRKTISGSFKQTVAASNQAPLFENKIIKALYLFDFNLPPQFLSHLLSLPEESLLHDLKKVLADSIARFEYFSGDEMPDEKTQFLLHAIFLIAEKRRQDLLPDVFNILKQGEQFIELYLGDATTELLWIALYKLTPGNTNILFNFQKESGIYTYCKTAVNQALEQLFYQHKNLQNDIIHGYNNLTTYIVEHRHDENLIDTEWIADVVCTMYDISPAGLDEEIKILYKHNLVSLGFAGSYESLTEDLTNPDLLIKDIPSIEQMYEHVITTWAGYLEEDDDDDNDWDIEDDEFYDDGEGDFSEGDDWKPQEPFVRTEPKTGRNNPCPCGSGKKYKNCCLSNAN